MRYAKNTAWMVLFAVFCLPLWGQKHETFGKGIACGDLTGLSSTDGEYRATRVIVDPATHQRWMFARDVTHPGFPARFIPLSGDLLCVPLTFEQASHRLKMNHSRPSLTAVHAGDALLVVEHTPVSNARFEASALSAGAVGEPITVRLKIGGRTLHAIVTAQGNATLLAAGVEARR